MVKNLLTDSRACTAFSIYARITPAVASGRSDMDLPLLSGMLYISFCTTSVSVPMPRQKRSVYSMMGVRSSPNP